MTEVMYYSVSKIVVTTFPSDKCLLQYPNEELWMNQDNSRQFLKCKYSPSTDKSVTQ